MTDETLADREALAKAIHDGPNAQKQYAEAGIAAHTWDSCRYQDQYLADADAGIAAGFRRGPDPTDDEREALRAEVEKVQRSAWSEIHGQDPQRKYSVAEVKRLVYSFDNVLSSAHRRSEVSEPRGDRSICEACGVPFHLVQHDEGCDEREPQGEPSDAQVLAALNARELSVRTRSGTVNYFTPAPNLSFYDEGNVEDMRAALRAADAAQTVIHAGEPTHDALSKHVEAVAHADDGKGVQKWGQLTVNAMQNAGILFRERARGPQAQGEPSDLAAHFEVVAYADDIAEGGDPVPENYEHHYCDWDGEDWPCARIRSVQGEPSDDERVARLMARVTPLGYSAALALIEAETKMLAEANAARRVGHDHADRCCREHGTHVSPHRGCILR